LLAVIGLAIGFLAIPTQVFACDCVYPPPPDLEAMSDVAFVGVVTAVDQALPGPRMDDPYVGPGVKPPGGIAEPVPGFQTIHFRVESVQQGSLDQSVEQLVQTGLGEGDCGMTFNVGERWQIYAVGSEGSLWTGSCSGNVLLGNSGFPPLPLNLSPLWLIPLLVAVVGGAAVVGYRRG
jgi:hypothetical protein